MIVAAPRPTEAHTITIEGEIDPGMVFVLQRMIIEVLASGRAGAVVVDLRDAGLPGGQTAVLLCAALRRLRRRRAPLTLVGELPALHRVAALRGFDLLALYRAPADTLTAMAGAVPAFTSSAPLCPTDGRGSTARERPEMRIDKEVLTAEQLVSELVRRKRIETEGADSLRS